MTIKEKFKLSNGITTLVCLVDDLKYNISGKEFYLVCNNEIKQTITILSERKMLKQKLFPNQKAFEIKDIVLLSQEDITDKKCQLIEKK